MKKNKDLIDPGIKSTVKPFGVTLYKDKDGWYNELENDPDGTESDISLCGLGLHRLFDFPNNTQEIELRFSTKELKESVKLTIKPSTIYESGYYAEYDIGSFNPQCQYLDVKELAMLAGSDTWYVRLLLLRKLTLVPGQC